MQNNSSDSCCTIMLCDVTLGDHEIKFDGPSDISVNLTDVTVINSTSFKLNLPSTLADDVTIEISEDNHNWKHVKPSKGNFQKILCMHDLRCTYCNIAKLKNSSENN